MQQLRTEVLIFLLLTLVFAVFDFRSHRVPLWLFALLAAGGILTDIFLRRDFVQILYALIPGLLLFLLSFPAGESLGRGDGLYLLLGGLFLSWQEVLGLLLLAFLLAGLVSLFLIVAGMFRGKSMRKKTLPFLTFMPPAILGVMALC